MRRYVFSGAGTWNPDEGMTQIPENCRFTRDCQAGDLIDNPLGNSIEANQVPSACFQQVFEAGDWTENLTLDALEPLRTAVDSPIMVEQPTTLEQLLRQYPGDCHWAACAAPVRGWPQNVQTPSGARPF